MEENKVNEEETIEQISSNEDDICEYEITDKASGFVIHQNGFVVCQFAIDIKEETDEYLELSLKNNDFFKKAFEEPMNIIIGYGDHTGIPVVLDVQKAQIFNIGPNLIEEDDIVFRIVNNDFLNERGFNFILRYEDVEATFSEELKEEINKNFNNVNEEDLSDIDKSYMNYIKHLYNSISNVGKDEK